MKLLSKPKILPPSLREKKRYIVGEIISDEVVEYDDFMSVVKQVLIEFLGELEYSVARVWVIQNLFDKENKRFVIQCTNNYTEKVRSALALVKLIGETKVILRVIGVTGTIKSAQIKYMGE